MLHHLPHKQLIASVVFLLAIAAPSTWAQENAQLQIPPSLVECYNTTYYMNRDNRLPSTINTLIDLVRKVENSPNFNMDARQLVVALLHRFRQDGIQRAAGVQASPGVLPYSPTGFQFPKFRILLSRLIQGNANTFPNSTLSQVERCSLHFMLSSSYNLRVRGDENSVCNRLSQYRANRLTRGIKEKPYKSNFLGDVELIETVKASKSGGAKANPYMDFDYWSETDTTYGNGNSISQCPVENGVIWTPWGSVSAGNLIAGIAAGLQPQTIQLRTLLALSRRPGQPGARQSSLTIDNRWAATLAGDLSEVALVQMPMSPSGGASVGAGGAWNDTVNAKWYFLSRKDNLEMTDAEIRGNLDGLSIAMNIAQWKNQASSLKLSQVLSMYYSLQGVLNTGIKACKRQEQFNTIAPENDMITQTTAFAQVLDTEMSLKVTLEQPAIQQFSQSAANELGNYIPQYLNDISCQASNPASNQNGDLSEKITPNTDIFVFLDTSWQFNSIVSYLGYVLDRINIAPYASTVTLISAGDCRIIANTTNHMSDVYQQWNVSTQATYSPGFNLPLILKTVQNLTQTLMNEQQRNNSVGGRSMVALMVPNMATVNEGDSNYVQIQLQYIYEQIPDLRFIYYTGGSAVRFNSFVRDPSKDLYPINLGDNNAASQGRLVVQRINEFPRRIINPRCGSSWYAATWGQDQTYQYVRPNNINFYQVSPNYFYLAGGSRQVSIQGASGTTLTVCTSRYIAQPTQNGTTSNGQSDISCQQLTNTGTSMTYDLSNACNGYYSIHSCPPLYISVQATSTYSSMASCIDNACQYPDEVRYQVSVQNMGCYSGVGKLLASLTVIAMAAVLRHLLV